MPKARALSNGVQRSKAPRPQERTRRRRCPTPSSAERGTPRRGQGTGRLSQASASAPTQSGRTRMNRHKDLVLVYLTLRQMIGWIGLQALSGTPVLKAATQADVEASAAATGSTTPGCAPPAGQAVRWRAA